MNLFSNIHALAIASALSLAASFGFADKLNVFACEPEWAALANSIGGEHLNISSATTAYQDPHHIQARPSLIAKMRQADLLICTGADLEIGWLPVLMQKSANKNIQANSTGNLLAFRYVDLLDVKTHVDRSMGDVHAQGNPHFHLIPSNVAKVGAEITARLSLLDARHADEYKKNFAAFKQSLSSVEARRQELAKKLSNMKIIVHHDSWPYLNQWLGMQQVATLEPIPGLPPSSWHLSKLIDTAKAQQADVIIHSTYQSPKAARWLSKKVAIPVLVLPNTVIDWKEKDALVNWYIELIDKLASI